MERRLATILVADMASYNRLMEQDEEGVIKRQKAHLQELIDLEITGHGGRIVKTTGDGVNVASRLLGLSQPGGVCLSDIVHQAVADRFREHFRVLGSQRVKNISRPIRVWQWTPDAPTEEKELAEPWRRTH